VQVLHDPRRHRFHVISCQTAPGSTSGPTTLGEFEDSEAAAACVEDALACSERPPAGPVP
jgi:hypothetical protein